MAHSGIKMHKDATWMLEFMKSCKSVKGFFMRINDKADAVIPDVPCGVEGVSDSFVDGLKLGDPKKAEIKGNQHYKNLVASAIFYGEEGGDVIDSMNSHFPDEDGRYAIVRLDVDGSDGVHPQKKDHIVMVVWTDDLCKAKKKMLYASTSEAVFKRVNASLGNVSKATLNEKSEVSVGEFLDKVYDKGAPDGLTHVDGREVERKKGCPYRFKESCSK